MAGTTVPARNARVTLLVFLFIPRNIQAPKKEDESGMMFRLIKLNSLDAESDDSERSRKKAKKKKEKKKKKRRDDSRSRSRSRSRSKSKGYKQK